VSRAALVAMISALGMGLVTLWLSVQSTATLVDPGDSEARTSSVPPVRVLLRGGSKESFQIRVDGPYRVVPPDDWRVLAQGESLGASEVVATSDGIRIGGRAFTLDRIVVVPISSGGLWLGDRRYRGRLLLVRRDGERVSAINIVSLDDYLASVINGEMPEDFPPAAREAQIIAARTYTLYQLKTFGQGRDYDVHDSARSQMYRGIEYRDKAGRPMLAETVGSRQLARQTHGIVLLYQGRVFCSYYSAVCGGHALDGRAMFRDATPPLVGVVCDDCRDAMNYRWERSLDNAAFHEQVNDYLAEQGEDLGRLLSVEVDEPALGDLPKVTITGQDGSLVISTDTLRSSVLEAGTLPSPMFTIEASAGQVLIKGRGWGHGVGLCQWGARHQGNSGRTAAEILQHYYPNTTLGWVR